MLASSGVNLWRKKGQSPVRPEDYFPRLREPEPEQTPEQMIAVARRLNALFGGEFR